MQQIQAFNSEKEEAAKMAALQGLAENFGKNLSPALMDMWLEMLVGCPADVVALGVRKVILSYEYKTLPPFAVLKAAIEDVCGVSDSACELMAVAEWERLGDLMLAHGSGNKPTLHPVTDYVLGVMGGWMNACCYWRDSEISFKRKEFLELWAKCYGQDLEGLRRLGAKALTHGRGGQEPLKIGVAMKAITAGDGANSLSGTILGGGLDSHMDGV